MVETGTSEISRVNSVMSRLKNESPAPQRLQLGIVCDDLQAGLKQFKLEYIPVEMFDTAQHISSRGPFLVAKEVLPSMRQKGQGSFFISNNSSSLRGRKRMTGQSLYYPRVMMRTLAQVLTEEYSEHGVHVANVIIDGLIDSPGLARYRWLRSDPIS